MSSREIILRNSLSTRLLERGYNVFLPSFDEGIDLIAHREDPWDLKLIQQKGRWTILKKYISRSIWIAFPYADEWYLIPHDEMLEWPEVAGFLETVSWKDKGEYHTARPSKVLLARCASFLFNPLVDDVS
jgi:hypothetical protein